jgi:hypothetical protein
LKTRPVQVELHAQAADLAGRRRVALVVPPGATGGDVKRRLAETCPALAELLAVSVLASDHEYLRDESPAGAVDLFHLVPPVSGG